LYEQQGKPAEEIAALKQSIEANPNFAEGHFYLAKAYLDTNGNVSESIRLARKGLQLDPNSPVAPLGHFVIAGALVKMGRQAEAARELAAGKALEARSAGRSR
jgi:tetratricopeptide (TPR) repeat protein